MSLHTYLNEQWTFLTEKAGAIKDFYYQDLINRYNSAGRYYHDLNHITSLLHLTDRYGHILQCEDAVRFAIWYHDAIYDTNKLNNEQESADHAGEQMSKMNIDAGTITKCTNLILATKTHTISTKNNRKDTGFMLDIDLSILAAPADEYHHYTQQIRKEYQQYPDPIYKAGRIKVLERLTIRPRIYHTEFFYEKWEKLARENISQELSTLYK